MRLALLFVFTAAVTAAAEKPAPFPKVGILPKTETGALRLLKKYPKHDGRGVVVAVFDTGVDPGAPGLQKTTDGKPKIIDMIDGTGSGDVKLVDAEFGWNDDILGLSGKRLQIDPRWKNPSGKFRVGVKRAWELFPGGIVSRLKARRKKSFEKEHRKYEQQLVAQIETHKAKFKKPTTSSRAKLAELEARLSQLRAAWKTYDDPGPMFDCVVFHDGKTWRAVIDTDSDGNLADETPFTTYRDEPRYGTFGNGALVNFGINIYDNGRLLSIVTDEGAHGTHVAGIIGANYPKQPERNGVAPGVQIVSVKIGDVRLGGMETAPGILRGLSAVVRNKCDLVNMSFGEESATPNRGAIIQEIRRIVEEHGVTFVASAGNEGPAMFTTGAPGGTTDAVIGVGAFATPKLISLAYGLPEPKVGRAYSWTSRGPATDGDWGVDIFAPGGAIAPVPTSTLVASQRMNGTSMSSPNCCGSLALMISGAKQEKVKYTPFSLRRAIQNTAVPIEGLPIVTQGPGFLQIDSAYEHLKKHSGSLGEQMPFKVSVAGKRGVIINWSRLRGNHTRINANVSPVFPKNLKGENAEKLRQRFELRCSVVSTAEWVKVEPNLLLTSSGARVPMSIAKPTSPGAGFAEVLGYDADHPERGPLFRIPVTSIHPMSLSNPRMHSNEPLTMTAGDMERLFVKVPPGATWATLQLKRIATEKEAEPMRMIVHMQNSLPGRDPRTVRRLSYPLIANSQTSKHLLKVDGGLLEVVFGPYWSQIGTMRVEMSLEFHGIKPSDQAIALPIAGRTPLELAAFQSAACKPVAKLTTRRSFIRAISSREERLTSTRDRLPGNRPAFRTSVVYEFEQAIAGNLHIRIPGRDDLLYEAPIAPFLAHLYGPHGRRLTTDDVFAESHRLGKGTYKLVVTFFSSKPIPNAKSMRVAIDRPLPAAVSVKFYADRPSAIRNTSAVGTFRIEHGARATIWAQSPAAPKTAQPGDVLLGSVQFADGQDSRPGGYPLRMFVPVPGAVSVPKAESPPKSAADLKAKLWRFQLAQLKLLKPDQRKLFDALSAQLAKDPVSKSALLQARLEWLDKPEHRKQHLGEVVAAADAVLKTIDREKLAAALAKRFPSDDTAAAKRKKAAEARRDLLASVLYRKGRALGYMELPEVNIRNPFADPKAHEKAFNATFRELASWVDSREKKYFLLHVRYERRRGNFGKALAVLNKQTPADPRNYWHIKKRGDLYESLKWPAWADRERMWLRVRFPNGK